MPLFTTLILLLIAALPNPSAAQCGTSLQPSSSPVTAAGVSYKLLLNGLGLPRGVAVDSEGNLLVVEQAARGIRRVVLSDAEGLDVCVESQATLIPNGALNHGIALSADGATLFASSSTDVLAYPYDASAGTVGSPKTIITGMQQGGLHQTRTLLIPSLSPGQLLVSRGSDGNIDTGTTDVGSGRSQIRVFDIASLMEGSAAVQFTEGEVVGWGLRNSVGVGEDPTTGNIWSVENSLDDMQRSGVDIHNTNPGEELNLHGRPNATTGANFGYPQCVAVWDAPAVQGYPGGAAAVGDQMTGDQTTGGLTDEYCQGEVQGPVVTFGAHLAPLDIKFQGDGAAAVISMHGSWDRQPGDGYRVSRVAFSEGMPTAEKTSMDAEVPLMWNADNSQCPNGCFRPVGLVFDAQERLFMTSDTSGELYVLTGVQNPR